MASSLNGIHQGDCIEALNKLDACSVDLAFADPPFNIGYDYDEYDDRQERDRYLAWSRDWIAAVYRVLKPDGSFWLAIGDEYAAELKLIAQNAHPGLLLPSGPAASLVESPVATRGRSQRDDKHATISTPKDRPGAAGLRACRPGAAGLQDCHGPRTAARSSCRDPRAAASPRKGRPRKNPTTGGFHCRNWVVWYYTFGVHCTHKFTRSHAHLFYFVKDPKRFTFNSLDVRVPSARELVYGDKRAHASGRVPDDTWMMTPVLPPEVATRDGFILRPQDIPDRFGPNGDTWFYSRVAGTFNERSGWHGCQMPEQLLGRIIRACSNKGDVVLDPFTGSGTTLAVAKKLNRRFIGFELSKEYAKQIEKRLASIKPGDPLEGPENAALSSPTTKAGRRLDRSNGSSKSPPRRKAASKLTRQNHHNTSALFQWVDSV